MPGVLLLSLTVLCALMLLLWAARRHRASLAWSQELEVAFRTHERRELSRHALN
jgi:hypothetical protein